MSIFLRSRVLLVLAMLAFALPLAAAEAPSESLAEVKSKVDDEQALLIDVREKAEWDRGHLEQAVHLPLSRLRKEQGTAALKAELAKLAGKKQVVYCHCQKGLRAVSAADLLKQMGVDARAIKAPYEKIEAAGFPPAQP